MVSPSVQFLSTRASASVSASSFRGRDMNAWPRCRLHYFVEVSCRGHAFTTPLMLTLAFLLPPPIVCGYNPPRQGVVFDLCRYFFLGKNTTSAGGGAYQGNDDGLTLVVAGCGYATSVSSVLTMDPCPFWQICPRAVGIIPLTKPCVWTQRKSLYPGKENTQVGRSLPRGPRRLCLGWCEVELLWQCPVSLRCPNLKDLMLGYPPRAVATYIPSICLPQPISEVLLWLPHAASILKTISR